jgi:hypothetical protein
MRYSFADHDDDNLGQDGTFCTCSARCDSRSEFKTALLKVYKDPFLDHMEVVMVVKTQKEDRTTRFADDIALQLAKRRRWHRVLSFETIGERAYNGMPPEKVSRITSTTGLN